MAKQIMGKYYRPPLSPRSRELKDLEFLKQSHKEKFKHLKIANGNDVDDDESFLSKYNGDDDEDFFDFVIVLTPQESYEYWANLLDFREEYLGLDSADVWERELDGVSTRSTDSPDSGEDSDKRKGIFNFFGSQEKTSEIFPRMFLHSLTIFKQNCLSLHTAHNLTTEWGGQDKDLAPVIKLHCHCH